MAYPIYGLANSGNRLLGTGVVLCVENTALIVTAAHVLSERKHYDALFLPYFDAPLPPVQAIETDTATTDLAVLVLPAGELPDRSFVRPLTMADLKLEPDCDPQSVYCVSGFPLSRNKQKPDMKFRPQLLSYTGGPSGASVYAALSRNPSSFVAVKFNQKQTIDRDLIRRNAPAPTGASGGPVWRLGTLPEIVSGKANPKLVALGIEWHPKLSAILSVHVSVLIGLLKSKLPLLFSAHRSTL
ncbi:MAG: S1 family peptidase [Thermoanaerobaculia bacterium]